jgi:hypothetical protein
LRSSQAGFIERAGQKILLQRQFPNPRMQQLQIDHMRGFSACSASAVNPCSTSLQLRFPGDNLGRMYLKQLGQFGQCLLAFDGCQGRLCLEAGAVGPACSLRHARS